MDNTLSVGFRQTLSNLDGDIDGLVQFQRTLLDFLFRSFDDDMMLRKGIASGFEFSVRCIPYIVAGHELHHVQVLKERYL